VEKLGVEQAALGMLMGCSYGEIEVWKNAPGIDNTSRIWSRKRNKMVDQTIPYPHRFCQAMRSFKGRWWANWPLLKELTIEKMERAKTQYRSADKVEKAIGLAAWKSWLRVGLAVIGQRLQESLFYEQSVIGHTINNC
jgi:hypothetical protein